LYLSWSSIEIRISCNSGCVHLSAEATFWSWCQTTSWKFDEHHDSTYDNDPTCPSCHSFWPFDITPANHSGTLNLCKWRGDHIFANVCLYKRYKIVQPFSLDEGQQLQKLV
jgi:hypothetical protein